MHDARVPGLGALSGVLLGCVLALAAGMNGSVGLIAGQLATGRGTRIAVHLLASAAIGGCTGVLCRPFARRPAAALGAGAVTGLVLWLLGPLSLASLTEASGAFWSAPVVGDAFPALIAFLLVGAGAGLGASLLVRALPAPADASSDEQSVATRVVILGGGFGGTAVAQRLQRHFRADTSVEVTLVSAEAGLLFTPMLAEVAGGALEAHHITAPLRAAAPGVVVRRGAATAIDADRRVVRYQPLGGGDPSSLTYDHLVLALGAVANTRDLPGVDEHAFNLKRLSDAVELRRHALDALECADAESDPAERSRLLTFVVAGGGFAGTEVAAELYDLVRSVLRFYPTLRADEPRVVLVHSRQRILPEIGDELARFALERLRRRGIEFVLGARVAAATDADVRLTIKGDDGDEPDAEHVIQTRTLVWTAGNKPHPLVAEAGLDGTDGGAAGVDETLRVPDHDGIWALGDCASVPVAAQLRRAEGDAYPPTAQHALRQGTACADNIAAVVRGNEPTPFGHRSLGTLVALGHRTAVAEIRGLRFAGFVAWVLWRAIYLAKLPGLEKKTRVGLDWLLELFFPRDIALGEEGERP